MLNEHLMRVVFESGGTFDAVRQTTHVNLNTFSKDAMADFVAPETRFYDLPPSLSSDSASGKGSRRRLAYHFIDGERRPTLLYLGGFLSTMQIHKCRAVEKLGRTSGHSVVTFDWAGVGQSSGDLSELVLSDWIFDAESMIADICPPGPVLIIASSLGGWIGLTVAARNRPSPRFSGGCGHTKSQSALANVTERICGLVLIGPFLKSYDELFDSMRLHGLVSDEDEARLRAGRNVEHKTPYGTAYISQRMFNDSRPFDISLRAEHEVRPSHGVDDYAAAAGSQTLNGRPIVDIRCAVRLLTALDDDDTPWERTVALMRCLTAADVDVVVRKAGNHRLMRPRDLTLIGRTVATLIDDLAAEFTDFAATASS